MHIVLLPEPNIQTEDILNKKQENSKNKEQIFQKKKKGKHTHTHTQRQQTFMI